MNTIPPEVLFRALAAQVGSPPAKMTNETSLSQRQRQRYREWTGRFKSLRAYMLNCPLSPPPKRYSVYDYRVWWTARYGKPVRLGIRKPFDQGEQA